MPVTIHRVHAGRTQIRRRLQKNNPRRSHGHGRQSAFNQRQRAGDMRRRKEVPSPTVMSVLPVFAAELMSTPGRRQTPIPAFIAAAVGKTGHDGQRIHGGDNQPAVGQFRVHTKAPKHSRRGRSNQHRMLLNHLSAKKTGSLNLLISRICKLPLTPSPACQP